jgi:hypothetical protein
LTKKGTTDMDRIASQIAKELKKRQWVTSMSVNKKKWV